MYINKTWDLVPRSVAQNILTSKWVFKKKEILNTDGSLGTKHRARIVRRGFQQKEGIEYAETYAPVVKFTTLRMFSAIVAHLDLHCHQMDVKPAFLNGDLDQAVYMEHPEGIVDERHPDHVCKLRKALYRLKQSPTAVLCEDQHIPHPYIRFSELPVRPLLIHKEQ